MSPASIASQTRYSVIILVILAGGSSMSGLFVYKIFPVSASTKIAVSASMSNFFACAVYGCVMNIVVITGINSNNAKLLLMLYVYFFSCTLLFNFTFLKLQDAPLLFYHKEHEKNRH